MAVAKQARWFVALALALAAGACRGGGGSFPWPRPERKTLAEHAEVRTANDGYRRNVSRVLVRAVERPTRATLDYAAYHANFMNADPEPEDAQASGAGRRPDVSNPFQGVLQAATLTGTIAKTPLTGAERARPLAFAPLVEYLAAKHSASAAGLEDVGAAVRAETWGLGGGPHIARQLAALAFLHQPGGGQPTEVWVKVELQPWFKAFGELPDEDGDGVPELYGRVRPDLVSAAAVAAIRDDYAGKPFGPADVKSWANQLSSYWYPSYNTDLAAAGLVWPDGETEADIKQELGSQRFEGPAVVMRGKPQGKAMYNVFLVKGVAGPVAGPSATPTSSASTTKRASVGGERKVMARVEQVQQVIKGELAASGGTWERWMARLAPFHEGLRRRLRTEPPKVKGLTGADGFLFFRTSLEYITGGDLTKQRKGKNPLPLIVEFKDVLASRGVDFLFVPVPTKAEVFVDKLDPKHQKLAGAVVNPYGRKLLMELAAAGVEVVDLLPVFAAERAKDGAAKEPLYQAQDTHWTARGLEVAAQHIGARIKQYPWYASLVSNPRKPTRFTVKDVPFTRYGDLHSRLPAALQRKYKPETLVGHQVIGPDGVPYEDDAESPIIVLGDSFTGVYQLTDCQHAGVSAHVARDIAHPVDLVMSYGGGPNVRQKLMRRGLDDLGQRRLVVWMMTARDLHNYWEDWEPLDVKGGAKEVSRRP